MVEWNSWHVFLILVPIRRNQPHDQKLKPIHPSVRAFERILAVMAANPLSEKWKSDSAQSSYPEEL